MQKKDLDKLRPHNECLRVIEDQGKYYLGTPIGNFYYYQEISNILYTSLLDYEQDFNFSGEYLEEIRYEHL